MIGQAVAIGARCKCCGSTQSELRRRTIQGGGLQFRWQCLNCGRATTDAISHSVIKNSDSLPAWDNDLNENFEDWSRKQAVIKRVQATAFGLTFSFEEHSRYLRTAIWQSKRALVMQRSRGKREGCGIRDADHVHHLTYAHWKDEFLWELVAVCLPCHERFHQRELKHRNQPADENLSDGIEG